MARPRLPEAFLLAHVDEMEADLHSQQDRLRTRRTPTTHPGYELRWFYAPAGSEAAGHLEEVAKAEGLKGHDLLQEDSKHGVAYAVYGPVHKGREGAPQGEGSLGDATARAIAAALEGQNVLGRGGTYAAHTVPGFQDVILKLRHKPLTFRDAEEERKHTEDLKLQRETTTQFARHGLAPQQFAADAVAQHGGAMDFTVEGRYTDLTRLLKDPRRMEPHIDGLAEAIVALLCRLGHQGYIYADLKPENLLVRLRPGGQPDVRIGDLEPRFLFKGARSQKLRATLDKDCAGDAQERRALRSALTFYMVLYLAYMLHDVQRRIEAARDGATRVLGAEQHLAHRILRAAGLLAEPARLVPSAFNAVLGLRQNRVLQHFYLRPDGTFWDAAQGRPRQRQPGDREPSAVHIYFLTFLRRYVARAGCDADQLGTAALPYRLDQPSPVPCTSPEPIGEDLLGENPPAPQEVFQALPM